MFCTQCGSNIPDGSRFCHVCGAEQLSPDNEQEKTHISYEQEEKQKQLDIDYYNDYSFENVSEDYNSPNRNDKNKISEDQNNHVKKGIIIGELIGTIVAAIATVIFVLNPFVEKNENYSNKDIMENNNITEDVSTEWDDKSTAEAKTEAKTEAEQEGKKEDTEVFSSTTYIYNVAVNTSSDDNYTNLSEISRSDTRYYHFQIGGLSAGEKIPLSYRITGTDGYTDFGVFDSDRGSDDLLWISFGYDNVSNVKRGTETVKVYRDDTHELIGKMSVEIGY